MKTAKLGELVRKKDDDLVGLLVAVPWEGLAFPGYESFVTDEMIEHMEGANGIYYLTAEIGLAYIETPHRFRDLVEITDQPILRHELLAKARI